MIHIIRSIHIALRPQTNCEIGRDTLLSLKSYLNSDKAPSPDSGSNKQLSNNETYHTEFKNKNDLASHSLNILLDVPM